MKKSFLSARLEVLPVLVCRKRHMKEEFLERRVEQLKNNLTFKPRILKAVVVNEESDVLSLKKHVGKADVILLFKPHLGQGSCVVRIAEYGLPIILFNEEGKVNNPLDAMEYVYPGKEVWVAVDYSDVDSCLKLLSVKKEMEHTKILVLNADYPYWEKFLCRVCGGVKAIKEMFGIDLEYVSSEEVIKRWRSLEEKRAVSVAEKWMEEAERVVEPEQKDLLSVARLYLVMKDFLEEKGAQAITMAYGDDPLPVPCFAYTNLRDEGIPAACEADIISLLSLIVLHYVADKPCFMGNTFVDLKDEAIILSHCLCPRKMKGYSTCAAPYVLRSYHKKRFAGSLTAFVKMNTDQEVTICRLGGNLKTMLITKGKIMSCEDLDHYCRVTVKIKIDDPRGFVHETSGNHHVMVYGDFREELRKLNRLFGVTTVEI
jgi:hypothetical protein